MNFTKQFVGADNICWMHIAQLTPS